MKQSHLVALSIVVVAIILWLLFWRPRVLGGHEGSSQRSRAVNQAVVAEIL